ncbi:LacI family DNA-binding transcriptional regulator [Mucisphaera calidilacus]|uniref:HTH-type transcriptional repressor PurR n=1 Tax=Mucisphaera calidilacus TaxID=2527982 RepID=A0A518BX46_9BACT|nr:LacI family DNA-binding transcriptional regulator [Mucisphaera calidilacus]QDU71549.1 HTH-type transcriptional repressor PurR [Mucisphaera calidilacus]
MSITIAQIAEKAGVSAGTVSRVLNGKNKENRPSAVKRSQLIRQIAIDHGYRPNQAARTVRTGRFGCIGFLSCSEPGADIFEVSLLHGIQRGLAETGDRLLMCELPMQGFEDAESIPQVLNEYTVDGLLIEYLYEMPDTTLQRIRDLSIPYVWLNAKKAHNCVYPNDFAGGRLAAQHLLEQGHQKIAYVSYHAADGYIHYSVHDRCDGFISAVQEAGFDPFETEISDGFVTGEAPAKARALLEGPDRPTAIICYERHETIAIWNAATSLGLRIPEDLSLICFGSDMMRNHTGLPVTTLITPFAQVGQAAVEVLHAEITQGMATRSPRAVAYAIEPSLSVGPPPVQP